MFSFFFLIFFCKECNVKNRGGLRRLRLRNQDFQFYLPHAIKTKRIFWFRNSVNLARGKSCILFPLQYIVKICNCKIEVAAIQAFRTAVETFSAGGGNGRVVNLANSLFNALRKKKPLIKLYDIRNNRQSQM